MEWKRRPRDRALLLWAENDENWTAFGYDVCDQCLLSCINTFDEFCILVSYILIFFKYNINSIYGVNLRGVTCDWLILLKF